jgi:UDPglucose--hexose-1-phosphate uridylyltransferase
VPEIRIDPLTGLRTVVAGERADRPGGGFSVPPRDAFDASTDPFLEGHEDRTPPEVYARRPGGGPPDSPGWTARVVPNLYPAFVAGDVVEEDRGPAGDPLSRGRGEPELFAAREALGAHEVVISSPRPVSSLLDLTVDELSEAMDVWRERMRAHTSASYVHVIVNEGREAGASLPHTHAQLYAMPFVPTAIARERERFTAYSERTQGRNLLEDLLQEEVRLRSRVIAYDSEAVALCPFASRVPFQLQFVPRKPQPRFETGDVLGAALLHKCLGLLARVFDGALPPFNMWVRTAPRGAQYFCWRIDLLPRLTYMAGLELGSGIYLNVVPPEQAASLLRDAK